MAVDSMMAATNRRRPPESGHCSTSMSRPRLISSAQVRLYEGTTFLGVLVDGPRSTSARPKQTTLLRHLAFGGTFKNDLEDSKAESTYGATLRWERPVHEYLATGLSFSSYAIKPEIERFRDPGFDVSLIFKGRIPFEMGKKEKRFESEAYVLVQAGLTIWIDSNAIDLNLIGPGWNVGVAPGYQFFINDRIGLLAEVGWIRTEAFFNQRRFNTTVHQAAVRLGMVIPY